MNPPRSGMPAMHAIVNGWLAHGDLPDAHFRVIGPGEPSCFRCGWLPPVPDTGQLLDQNPGWDAQRAFRETWKAATRYLDRGHLVDYYATQDSSLENLVPLCHYPCHFEMPEFGEGKRAEAVAWVAAGRPEWHRLWQVFTDVQGRCGTLTSRRQLRSFYVRFLEALADVRRQRKAAA